VTSLQQALRRGVVALAAGSIVAVGVAGCAGPTNIAVQQAADSPYILDVVTDPHTLNPPQLTTLNFTITDRQTGKPVTAFTPVYGALLHNVLISRDLLHFKHSYTDRFAQGGFSVLTNFPVTGEYFNHTYFQPQGAGIQHVRTEIASGTAEMRADLVADPQISRFSQGVQNDILLGAQPLRAGQPSQIALYIREKGQPVTKLDSFLGGPGLMFVSSQDGEHFAVEQGSAPGYVNAAASGTPSGTPASATVVVPTQPATGSTPGTEQQVNSLQASGTPAPAPTLVPGVENAMATLTAQPVATLVPVQQTAMVSVVETPAVVPSVSYGPYVAFTHTFPAPGLYKLWFETSYRQRVMLVDFVVRVEQ
jgi:hypothetical protein